MGFEYLTNVPLDKAREDYRKLLTGNGFAPKTEVIPVWDACGRVTAHAVYAHICAPHYAASAMDGVAVNAKDTFGATETTPVTLTAEFFRGKTIAFPIFSVTFVLIFYISVEPVFNNLSNILFCFLSKCSGRGLPIWFVEFRDYPFRSFDF